MEWAGTPADTIDTRTTRRPPRDVTGRRAIRIAMTGRAQTALEMHGDPLRERSPVGPSQGLAPAPLSAVRPSRTKRRPVTLRCSDRSEVALSVKRSFRLGTAGEALFDPPFDTRNLCRKRSPVSPAPLTILQCHIIDQLSTQSERSFDSGAKMRRDGWRAPVALSR